jgi:cytochrome c2
MSRIKNSLCLFFLFGVALLLSAILAGCSTMYDGQKLFYSVGCSQCHTVNGKGGRMGPDLSGVTDMRSDSWIMKYIHDPKAVNPNSRMHAFKHLSRAKREAIVAFLKK